MPLLMHLGYALGNKIPCEVFQRHRGSDRWKWKETGRPAVYETRLVKAGKSDQVAVILSLSAALEVEKLPAEIAQTATVYELTLANQTPDPTFLNTRADLSQFGIAYQGLLGLIQKEHGTLQQLDVFPAVPAPIAVLCGRELLPKVHPPLRIYDRSGGQWAYQLTVQLKPAASHS